MDFWRKPKKDHEISKENDGKNMGKETDRLSNVLDNRDIKHYLAINQNTPKYV